MSAKPEKTDKIDNIVGMLMEYERMTIDLMKKASDTPILDQYDLRPPYSKARLIKEEGQVKYQIIEVPLSDDEKAKLREIGELLVEELDVDVKKLGGNQNAAAYIRKMVDKIIKNYKIKVTPDGLDRIMYYITRDFVFFDKIDPMMRDPWTPSTPLVITARGAENSVVLSVADRGPGIPEAERSRIFDKFYRSARNRHQITGAGMGLTIAREILRAHGGDVWVKSGPGQGSEF